MTLNVGFLELISKNLEYSDSKIKSNEYLSPFSRSKPFPMKLDLYIDHILYQLNLSQDILAHCFIILEDILNSNLINKFNVHRLVFVAFSLSYKFTINSWISNRTLEGIGCLKKGELKDLETQLLRFLNWRLKFHKVTEVHKKIEEAAILREDNDKNEEESEDIEQSFEQFEEGQQTVFSELEDFFPIGTF